MKRVAVIGCGGSGKSTMSRKLGEITNLPVYHLDALHFEPGWVAMPKDRWVQLQQQIIQEDKWIIDGNYGRTIDIRMNEADTIIFFDLPRWITLYRVIKRRMMYHGRTRPDLREGCPERLDWKFLRWVWGYRSTQRPDLIKKLESLAASKTIYIIKTNADSHRLFEQIQKGQPILSNFN